MNSFATANPLENPLVLLALAAVWVIANLLMKRRQRSEADDRRSAPEAEGCPERAPTLQEVLGQLLGGEPSPQAPPPPSRALRDGDPSPRSSDEEQAGRWLGETSEAYEATRPPLLETAAPPQPETVLARAYATRTEAGESPAEDARPLVPLLAQAEHPATVASSAHVRRSRRGASAGSLWRDPRRARRAFVAALLFAQPKAFEK